MTHPDDAQSVLDKEIEHESDDTDEGEDSNASALPSLGLIQFLLGDIPARLSSDLRTVWSSTYKMSSLNSLRAPRSCFM